MIHGLIDSETFAGIQLRTAPSRSFYNKIGLTHTSTYVWRGYRTSILRHMIDTQEEEISAQEPYTIHVRICNLMPNAGQQLADTVRNQVGGIALGVAGGINRGVDLMNNVVDGLTAATVIGGLAPDRAPNVTLKRPGRAEYMKDHALNDRIEVRIEANTGDKPGWTDLETRTSSVGAIAHLVQSYKP